MDESDVLLQRLRDEGMEEYKKIKIKLETDVEVKRTALFYYYY